jgi:glycine cleavage system H protein
MSVPTELHYTADHEWVALDGDIATVGITAFAGEALGDVVYVDLPAVGTAITTGDACGEIESTKSVSDLFAPVDGEVIELNDAVVADPGLLNTDPYQAGWLVRIKVTGPTNLLDAGAYEALIGGE